MCETATQDWLALGMSEVEAKKKENSSRRRSFAHLLFEARTLLCCQLEAAILSIAQCRLLIDYYFWIWLFLRYSNPKKCHQEEFNWQKVDHTNWVLLSRAYIIRQVLFLLLPNTTKQIDAPLLIAVKEERKENHLTDKVDKKQLQLVSFPPPLCLIENSKSDVVKKVYYGVSVTDWIMKKLDQWLMAITQTLTKYRKKLRLSLGGRHTTGWHACQW